MSFLVPSSRPRTLSAPLYSHPHTLGGLCARLFSSERVFDFQVESPHLPSIIYPKPHLLPSIESSGNNFSAP